MSWEFESPPGHQTSISESPAKSQRPCGTSFFRELIALDSLTKSMDIPTPKTVDCTVSDGIDRVPTSKIPTGREGYV